MLTTIRQILKSMGVSLENTIYSAVEGGVVDFPLSIGDFFKLKKDDQGASDFEILNKLYILIQGKKENSEYETVCSELQQITSRLKEMKNIEISTAELKAEKSELRNNKKKLSAKKAALEESYLAHSIEEAQKEHSFGLEFLEYKEFMNCSYFSEVAAMLPQVAVVDTPKLKEMPLFVRGIYDMARAIKNGRSLGITGGPCLFGTHEVIIDIYHSDGEVVQFDFSRGRAYNKTKMLSEIDIESYCNNRYKDIVRLELTNFKRGVTLQEYFSIQYLFEFARALDAKVVIPIPDMSYMKFFKGATKLIADDVKEPAFKAFEKISHDITDMYLKVITDLQKRYPNVECQVLHSRDTALCELFYTKRKKYIQNLTRLGKVTVYEGKLEAIIDYITMVALPYYFYGTRNVLQLDSVDETDSLRKCIKIHDDDVAFHSILFPEYLSEDGVNTIFNAPLEFKDYISVGG